MDFGSMNIQSEVLEHVCFITLLKWDRDPLTHRCTDFMISNDTRVLSHDTIMSSFSPCFFANCSANFFMDNMHSVPIPPLVPKTSGVN